jgi:putative sigma-54 modulation protein
MKLEIVGKSGFVITDAIRNYVEKKLSKIDRLFTEQLDAVVVCKVYRDGTKVEITIPIKFLTLRAEVKASDYAVDEAVDKLEAQLRKNKHKMNRSLQEREGLKNTFSTDDLDLEELEKELIDPVKKKKISLEILSLEEALTQMDLLDHDFFIYKNEDNETCILYLRDDGKYGLIETE